MPQILLKNQLLMLWTHNITELSKWEHQLKLSMLFLILVQAIFGYHQKNVGHQRVSYTKLMITVNPHHIKLTELKLTLIMDQEVLKGKLPMTT